VEKGSVIDDQFEHASIPGTITELLLGNFSARSPREIAANTFLNYLSLDAMRADGDCPTFSLD
jgi:phospholipase C